MNRLLYKGLNKIKKKKNIHKKLFTEVVVQRCSAKEVLLKISQNSQETQVLESLFNNVSGLRACNFIKKRLEHRCFPVNFAKFLRRSFLIEQLRWLLLSLRPMPRNGQIVFAASLQNNG